MKENEVYIITARNLCKGRIELACVDSEGGVLAVKITEGKLPCDVKKDLLLAYDFARDYMGGSSS